MAFLDDIHKSVAEAANYTAKKATELSGIAKLKLNIKSEEATLERCYCDIGRLFYTAEREGVDHTTEISTLIMQVDKIIANITACREELSKHKKTVTCKACSAEVPKEFAFCPSCGAKIEKECENCSETCEDEDEQNCCCDDDCCCESDESCDCSCGEEENDCSSEDDCSGEN